MCRFVGSRFNNFILFLTVSWEDEMAVKSTFHKTHCGKTCNKASAPSEQSDYLEWSGFSYDIIPVWLTFSIVFVVQVTCNCKHSICNPP